MVLHDLNEDLHAEQAVRSHAQVVMGVRFHVLRLQTIHVVRVNNHSQLEVKTHTVSDINLKH